MRKGYLLAGLAPFMLPLAPAQAAAPGLSEPPPPRVSTLVVYGNDPCPRSKDDEIVVCARQPESERYRIPRELRKKKPEPIMKSKAFLNTCSTAARNR